MNTVNIKDASDNNAAVVYVRFLAISNASGKIKSKGNTIVPHKELNEALNR